MGPSGLVTGRQYLAQTHDPASNHDLANLAPVYKRKTDTDRLPRLWQNSVPGAWDWELMPKCWFFVTLSTGRQASKPRP